ncbi:MAG TPA: DUF1800 domain-containing protein [Terriglobales bacterium]|nr:DUF1800 domain-containing protein [Terriglobales bacterium]
MRARPTLVAAVAGLALFFTAASPVPAPKLDHGQQIIQALNRLTWGIAPGDIELVQKIGLKNWIDQQLHPERVVENPELTQMLQPLDTLFMNPVEMNQHYPDGQMIQAMAMGRQPRPSDPKLRAVVDQEIARYRERLAAKDDKADKAGEKAGDVKPNPNQSADADEPVEPKAPALSTLLSADQIAQLETGGPKQRVAALESMPKPTRDAVLAALPRKYARQLEPWVPIDQAHQIASLINPQQVVPLDLLGAKVLRAVYTNRQLEDVLTDFWFNHFNVYINKGKDRGLITSYERDAIRPHVLGKFSDLLLATAESPAMLFYLDNWQSVDPSAEARLRNFRNPRRPAAAAAEKRGLNENYGREIMELHTLGVNGGYTQKDVTEVARCFTGWTLRTPQLGAEFQYNDLLHDKGAKVVLGVTIPAGGGMDDGLKVIQILSRSPATAHHISYELAQRFIADEPPPALVERMAATYMKSGGDLRQVMQTMIASPEFWDPAYYRNQVKSPLELVVSSVRALGADVSNPARLTQIVAAMGEPLYAKEPPTGYTNVRADWLSSGGLVTRLNFAMQLAANQVPGVQVDISNFAVGEARLPDVEQNVFQSLLFGQASDATRAAIAHDLGGDQPDAATPATPAQVQRIAGLALGSPDFQKR